MAARSFPIPEPVRLRAQSLGPSGLRWLDDLGDIVAGLERSWSMEVGRVLSGGSESLVAEVVRVDGSKAILKVGMPGSADLATEARVFRLADGRGYARLYEHDALRNTLLLEQLGEPLARRVPDLDGRLGRICQTLTRAWIPLSENPGLMTGAEKARWLMGFIEARWAKLDRPCRTDTIEQALACAEMRAEAFPRSECVLVHGDAHALNALAAPDGEGYRFVDPDGLWAERACDLAVPMRDDNDVLLAGDTAELARQRCDLLASLTGVDREAIWQWGFVERVSTGLSLVEIGMGGEGATYLAVADRLARP